MVFGVVVRSMGIARNIGAGFKSLAGGEVKQYTRLVEDSRRHALDRMIENAQLIGGEGIISMRFDSSEVGQTLTEIVAYGTVVTFESRRSHRMGVVVARSSWWCWSSASSSASRCVATANPRSPRPTGVGPRNSSTIPRRTG